MSVDLYDPQRGDEGYEDRLEPLSKLMGAVTGTLVSQASPSMRALAAWRAACGKRERDHTVAVYLAEPDDPRNARRIRYLTVYVDSSALLQDFSTNSELYVIKLARQGLEVADVQFRLSRRASQDRRGHGFRSPENESR